MSDAFDLAAGLARALGDAWGAPVTVRGLSASTAGARRTNIAFDAEAAGVVRRLVATIVPDGLSAELGQNPIGVEAELRTRAEQAGVPVPHVEFVTDDPSYVGGPMMISAFVDGETVPRRVLRLIEQQGIGDLVATQIGAALAHLHSIDTSADTGVFADAPAPAMLDLLGEAVAGLPQPRPAMELGLRWLRDRLPPAPARTVIVHGDVRNGNLIVGPDGLRAVLDWELAQPGGDPMNDLAWGTVRMWRFGNDAREYGGFAGREPLIDGYVAAGGDFAAERFAWWKAARTLWWAVGLAGQAMSFVDGRVPNIVMAASGRRVSELEWDLLMLIRPESD